MVKKVYTWIILGSLGLTSVALGADPNQYDYTVPARAQLTTGTLSGLVAAYQTLDEGLDDPNLTGDDRELKFLYVIARTGMLLLDTADVGVTTSVAELAAPYGVTISGDKFFVPDPEDPNHLEFLPSDPCDPDAFQIHVPMDPCDPNCYLIPDGLDPTILDTTASAVNSAILPEIDTLISLLDTITDSPTAFAMTLTMAETGLESDVEVDLGDVLTFKAALLIAKTICYGAANSPYDVTVDLTNALFDGWTCGQLPDSTTLKAVLAAYPNLLEILTPSGAGRLAQAKTNVTAALEGALAAIDYMVAETDDQLNDVLSIDSNSLNYVRLRGYADTLRSSLAGDTAGTYTVRSRATYVIRQAGETVGQFDLLQSSLQSGYNDARGLLTLTGEAGLPASQWVLGDFHIGDDNGVSGDSGWSEPDLGFLWFSGDSSSDRTQFTNLTFSIYGTTNYSASGLTATRTNQEATTVQFNPNPLFAGSVSPRDLLPQLDVNDVPVAGTFGHALGDDATLGGVTPGMTQDDWIGTKYAVYGVEVSDSYGIEALLYYVFYDDDSPWGNIEELPGLVTKLGESDGSTQTFSGDYPWYIVAVQSEMLLDSVYGVGNAYLDANDTVVIVNTNGFDSLYEMELLTADAVRGAPDDNSVAVGELGLLGRDTGLILIENPGTWTSVTVVTGTEPTVVLHDWNGDGIVSIVGDVPGFVDCVYFNNCPGGVDTIAIGDCNGDGILSIVGDVPCFVDCVYFSNCP